MDFDELYKLYFGRNVHVVCSDGDEYEGRFVDGQSFGDDPDEPETIELDYGAFLVEIPVEDISTIEAT